MSRYRETDAARTPSPAEQLAGAPLFAPQPVQERRGPAPWSTEDVPPPRARQADPETSHDAAVRALGSAKDQQKFIVGVLRACGGRGATAKEIAEKLGPGWDNVIISRRISGLRQAGYLVSYDGGPRPGDRYTVGRLAPALERDGCTIHVAVVNGKQLGAPSEIRQDGAAA